MYLFFSFSCRGVGNVPVAASVSERGEYLQFSPSPRVRCLSFKDFFLYEIVYLVNLIHVHLLCSITAITVCASDTRLSPESRRHHTQVQIAIHYPWSTISADDIPLHDLSLATLLFDLQLNHFMSPRATRIIILRSPFGLRLV